MARQRRRPGVVKAIEVAARAWCWWLAWALVLQAAILLPPIAALAWTGGGCAAFLLYPRLGRKRWRRRRSATLRLRGWAHPWPWLPAASLLLPIFAAVFTVAYHRLCPGDYAPSISYAHARDPLGWLIIPLIGCVQAPLVEELAFRGHLQGRLARWYGEPIAATAGAAAFAFCHLSPGWLLYYFTIGLLLAYAVTIARSVWTAVALHSATNFFIIVLSRPRGELQDRVDTLPSPMLALVVVALAAMTLLVMALGKRVERRAAGRGAGGASRPGSQVTEGRSRAVAVPCAPARPPHYHHCSS